MLAALLSEARFVLSVPVSQFCPRSRAAIAGMLPVERSDVNPEDGAKFVHVTLTPLQRDGLRFMRNQRCERALCLRTMRLG